MGRTSITLPFRSMKVSVPTRPLRSARSPILMMMTGTSFWHVVPTAPTKIGPAAVVDGGVLGGGVGGGLVGGLVGGGVVGGLVGGVQGGLPFWIHGPPTRPWGWVSSTNTNLMST